MITNNNIEENILPFDGDVTYIGELFDQDVADQYFQLFKNELSWNPDKVKMFGKTIMTKRQVAWYGHQNYTYSNVVKIGQPWTTELHKMKTRIESILQTEFNSCLCNLYKDGKVGMGWHSDDEIELGVNPCIASVSFGEGRIFSFRHKFTSKIISIRLAHGSLLVMKGSTQQYWKHSIPKSAKVVTPRVNLTFRKIM